MMSLDEMLSAVPSAVEAFASATTGPAQRYNLELSSAATFAAGKGDLCWLAVETAEKRGERIRVVDDAGVVIAAPGLALSPLMHLAAAPPQARSSLNLCRVAADGQSPAVATPLCSDRATGLTDRVSGHFCSGWTPTTDDEVNCSAERSVDGLLRCTECVAAAIGEVGAGTLHMSAVRPTLPIELAQMLGDCPTGSSAWFVKIAIAAQEKADTARMYVLSVSRRFAEVQHELARAEAACIEAVASERACKMALLAPP